VSQPICQVKKVCARSGTLLKRAKNAVFVDSAAVPAQTRAVFRFTAAEPPSPEIYHPSG
jgi:hypothetical protein